jgi:hypothetical protein
MRIPSDTVCWRATAPVSPISHPCRKLLPLFPFLRARRSDTLSSQLVCFQVDVHSLALREIPTQVFSWDCALFRKNTRGVYPPLLTPNSPVHCPLPARTVVAQPLLAVLGEVS